MNKTKRQFATKRGAHIAPDKRYKGRAELRKRAAILLAVVAFAVVLFAFWFASSTVTSADQRLNTFLSAAKAPNDVREAYYFAASHPDVLKAVPCYCNCISRGHKDNYNCFISANGEFDQHGLNCGMCVQTALKAKRLYEEGASLLEIRKQVDETYQELPDFKPTPTPLPSKGQSL